MSGAIVRLLLGHDMQSFPILVWLKMQIYVTLHIMNKTCFVFFVSQEIVDILSLFSVIMWL